MVVYLGADCAEWDGFRAYDCLDARGSLIEIRSYSSTPSGEIACFQDVLCLMCTNGARLGSGYSDKRPSVSRDTTYFNPLLPPTCLSDICLKFFSSALMQRSWESNISLLKRGHVVDAARFNLAPSCHGYVQTNEVDDIVIVCQCGGCEIRRASKVFF